ncbi:hypothetical protein IPJ72_06310 [Candidatus Peregrinibacteria bacterium]|nr:MAG: hypothetical protein IPJ72_06310 [Candidatus Peregrinibacteria bacterium]
MKLDTLKKKFKKGTKLAKKPEQIFKKHIWIVIALSVPVIFLCLFWIWQRLSEPSIADLLPASSTQLHVEWKPLPAATGGPIGYFESSSTQHLVGNMERDSLCDLYPVY